MQSTTTSSSAASSTRKWLSAFCYGLAALVGNSILLYLDNTYTFDPPYLKWILIVAVSLVLIVISAFLIEWRTSRYATHAWPTVLLSCFVAFELLLYLGTLSYAFRPCNWLDIPRRIAGCT